MKKQALRDAIRAFDATAFGDICPMPGKWGKPSFAPPVGVHPRLMFLKSELDALRKKLLPEGMEEMNDSRLRDPDANTIIAAAETLPFLADKRLVIIRDHPALTGRADAD